MDIYEIARIIIPSAIIGLCGYIYNRHSLTLHRTIGELDYRVREGIETENRLKIRLAEKDLKIAEEYKRIEEQTKELIEKKEDTKSLRSIINRNEGRISVYVENELSYMKELAQMRTTTLVAEAKQQGLLKENTALRLELESLKQSSTPATPAPAGE